jgi:hypothetical protein
MNHVAKARNAELDLGRRSKHLAEDERGLVAPDRLAQTITEFIEWRAFSYWLRLTVETQGFVSDPMIAILRESCRGFLDYAAAYAKEHPREPEFLWLRFLEWTDEKLFHVSIHADRQITFQMSPDRLSCQTGRLAVFAGLRPEIVIAAAFRVRPHRLENVGAPIHEQLPIVLHICGSCLIALGHSGFSFRPALS